MKRRNRYSKEFKVEAVRLITEEGNKTSVVAKELGVHPATLSRWRREFREDGENSFPGKGHMKPEKEELARVKRENRRLRMENEILKKTVGYFAKDEE
jgi:transposase